MLSREQFKPFRVPWATLETSPSFHRLFLQQPTWRLFVELAKTHILIDAENFAGVFTTSHWSPLSLKETPDVKEVSNSTYVTEPLACPRVRVLGAAGQSSATLIANAPAPVDAAINITLLRISMESSEEPRATAASDTLRFNVTDPGGFLSLMQRWQNESTESSPGANITIELEKTKGRGIPPDGILHFYDDNADGLPTTDTAKSQHNTRAPTKSSPCKDNPPRNYVGSLHVNGIMQCNGGGKQVAGFRLCTKGFMWQYVLHAVSLLITSTPGMATLDTESLHFEPQSMRMDITLSSLGAFKLYIHYKGGRVVTWASCESAQFSTSRV